MHRTSGLNPLIACVRRAEARENFHKVTVAWEPVFERALVKGYRMQASDLLALRNAACGQVPCLLHRGQVFYWARYNAMSAARTCELLFQSLGRSPTNMTEEVFDVLQKDQAKNTFAKYQVECFDDFRLLGSRLQKAMIQSPPTIKCRLVWQGQIVSMCEVRQSAQKYTWLGLERVVKELERREAYKESMVICPRRRNTQSMLMQQPYVGMCHASYMFTHVINSLNLKIPV